MNADFAIEPLAEDALLLRFGDGIDIDVNARVHAAANAIRAARLGGIVDIAPAYATLLVRFDAPAWIGDGAGHPFDRIGDRLRAAIENNIRAAARHEVPDPHIARDVTEPPPPHPTLSPEQEAVRGRGPVSGAPAIARLDTAFAQTLAPPLPQAASPLGGEGWGEGADSTAKPNSIGAPKAGSAHPHPTLSSEQEAVRGRGLSSREELISQVVDIPVCYGGECGPDIDAVAKHSGLSPDEVIERHMRAEYTVAMLGFAPGFPYLLGLDPALHVPRRVHPRTRVPAGSVAIGGAQTGIYPRELPGGWNLIGCTPLALFDPAKDPPCLLAPGDRVRFRAIDADEFRRRAERGA